MTRSKRRSTANWQLNNIASIPAEGESPLPFPLSLTIDMRQNSRPLQFPGICHANARHIQTSNEHGYYTPIKDYMASHNNLYTSLCQANIKISKIIICFTLSAQGIIFVLINIVGDNHNHNILFLVYATKNKQDP